MADCKHPMRNVVGQCDDCYLYLEPEPTSPSVDQWQNQCDKNGFHYCSVCDRTIASACPQCTRHEADAERLAGMNRELKEELILRNQDIEDYKLRTKNLSRKIVEDQKKRAFVGGVHGS